MYLVGNDQSLINMHQSLINMCVSIMFVSLFISLLLVGVCVCVCAYHCGFRSSDVDLLAERSEDLLASTSSSSVYPV